MTRDQALRVAEQWHEAHAYAQAEAGHPVDLPWTELPDEQRDLLTEVVRDLLDRKVIRAGHASGPGRVERAVRAAARGRASEPLVQAAFLLARELDMGVEDKALAGLARELRITLEALGVNAGQQQEVTVGDEVRSKREERQRRRRAVREADAST